METEFLKQAPLDATEIRRFTSAVRRLAKFAIPEPAAPWPRNWLTFLHTLPYLLLRRRWSSVSCEEYGKRFTHPLLRRFFGEGDLAQLSALALVLSLTWMSEHDAGYPIGGSPAVIRPVVDKLLILGGHLRLGAKVERILVERDAAVGVQLAGGETIAADWVSSAADGHATIYDLLGGKYTDRVADKIYRTLPAAPPIRVTGKDEPRPAGPTRRASSSVRKPIPGPGSRTLIPARTNGLRMRRGSCISRRNGLTRK